MVLRRLLGGGGEMPAHICSLMQTLQQGGTSDPAGGSKDAGRDGPQAGRWV